jgi:hypothetical protein
MFVGASSGCQYALRSDRSERTPLMINQLIRNKGSGHNRAILYAKGSIAGQRQVS